MPDTLAQRIRAKYPDAYADMSDQQLEAAVTAKYPGVYDDIPRSSGTPSQAEAPEGSMLGNAARTVADVAIGAGKGALNTVGGLGQMVRKIPGVNALDRVMEPVSVNTTPSNTAQKVGFGAEQIGEFFVPAMGTGNLATKAVKAAGLTMAQTGSPTAAVVSGGITAALPGVTGAVARVAGGLKKGAEKSVAQALGATKEWAKADAAKLAPQMLDRGVKGSREAMLKQARSMAAAVGQRLDDAYQQAAAAGATVSGPAIRTELERAAGSLAVTDAQGAARLIPGTDRVARQLSKLDEFVATLGDDIPVDKAAAVKRTWDRIVSKAGLYGQKATSSATDSADAWAIREASSAFRELINKSPTLADLNKEAAFWTGLKKVLVETEKRTQAQSGGLTSAITGAAGAASGFASGQSTSDRIQNALIGGALGRQLVRGMQSPWFRTAAAGPAKQALADALASGQTGKIIGAVSKVTQALPARVAGQ